MSQQTKELRRIIAHLEKIVKVLEELEHKAPDPRQRPLFEEEAKGYFGNDGLDQVFYVQPERMKRRKKKQDKAEPEKPIMGVYI